VHACDLEVCQVLDTAPFPATAPGQPKDEQADLKVVLGKSSSEKLLQDRMSDTKVCIRALWSLHH
jgi:hypothetical protein